MIQDPRASGGSRQWHERALRVQLRSDSGGARCHIIARVDLDELQEPKMELLHTIDSKILKVYLLKFSSYLGLMYGRHHQFRFLRWPLMKWVK